MVSYDLYSWSFLLIVIKVIFAFISSFLAIFLWSKTRQAAQIFLVMTVLSVFIKLIYDVLLIFGFLNNTIPYLKDFPIFSFIFSLLPYLFLILTLIFFIKEK